MWEVVILVGLHSTKGVAQHEVEEAGCDYLHSMGVETSRDLVAFL